MKNWRAKVINFQTSSIPDLNWILAGVSREVIQISSHMEQVAPVSRYHPSGGRETGVVATKAEPRWEEGKFWQNKEKNET